MTVKTPTVTMRITPRELQVIDAAIQVLVSSVKGDHVATDKLVATLAIRLMKGSKSRMALQATALRESINVS